MLVGDLVDVVLYSGGGTDGGGGGGREGEKQASLPSHRCVAAVEVLTAVQW